MWRKNSRNLKTYRGTPPVRRDLHPVLHVLFCVFAGRLRKIKHILIILVEKRD